MTLPSIKLNSGISLWLSIFFFLLKFGIGGNLLTKWDLISKFGDSFIAQLVKNLPAMQETPVWFLGQKIHWRRDRLPTPVLLGFPCGSTGKEPTYNVGDLVSIPGLGRSPGEGKDYPLQYSGLENSMDCIVHGVAKSWTWLSNFHFHFIYLYRYIKIWGQCLSI